MPTGQEIARYQIDANIGSYVYLWASRKAVRNSLHTLLVFLLFVAALGWMLGSTVLVLLLLFATARRFCEYYIISRRPLVLILSTGLIYNSQYESLTGRQIAIRYDDIRRTSNSRRWYVIRYGGGKKIRLDKGLLDEEDLETLIGIIKAKEERNDIRRRQPDEER